MELSIYQVDAFADEVFKGNPAAVVPLTEWLSDKMLQAIAAENNLSETAYVVPHENGTPGHYYLRWFTPGTEVDLCGHATLGTAYVLREFLGVGADEVSFETRSGTLVVTPGEGGWLSMDFPSWAPQLSGESKSYADILSSGLGTPVSEVWAHDYYGLAIVDSEAAVRGIEFSAALVDALAKLPYWGLIVSAKGEGKFDCISRFFAPEKGVAEDPVTGSAHCVLAPYWADRLGKTQITAYQASERGGTVKCRMKGDRVTLSGRAAPYLNGTISV